MADRIRVVNQSTVVQVIDRRSKVQVKAQGVQGDPGPQGIQGPPGPPGVSGGVYVHDQVVASATWTITHNLGVFPNVSTVDTAGTLMLGGLHYDSGNQLTVSFSTPQSGKAYLS